MTKKRISVLVLSMFLSLCASLFANFNKNESLEVKAEDAELVDIDEVAWNNVDYSGNFGKQWVANRNENGVPQEGYCLLSLYKSDISLSEYITENLLDATIEGCNVADHILINGVQCKDVDDVIIYAYPTNGFFLYVPATSFSTSDDYPYLTIEVLEGMSIDGSAKTVGTSFEYRGLLKSFGNWKINPEPVEFKEADVAKIEWNNRDYSGTMGQQWSGELNGNGSPINGYCMIAFFNEKGKTYEETVIGDVTVSGRGVIGFGIIDTKIKVNGINIIDVVDSKCYLFPQYGLYFYLPYSSLTFTDEYKFPVITLEEGIHFNNVILPSISFEFRGELGEPDRWTYLRNPSEYNHVEFTDVAGGWNNVPLNSTHNHTILQFGQYDVDYLKNDKEPADANLVSKYSYCGLSIFVNGVSLSEIGDAIVSYAHGYCYVYIVLPNSVLKPSPGYKVCNLHINKDTIFYDSMLGETDLYLFNGEWVKTRPETPEDEEYDNAVSFEDVFSLKNATLDENNKKLSGTNDKSISNFDLYFDYKLVNELSSFDLLAFGNESQNGIKVSFRRNILSLVDSTQRDVILQEIELPTFIYDEWFSILFYTKIVNDQLSIAIAIDDIVYIHIDNVSLKDVSNLGNKFSISLLDGTISLKNASYGADIKKPVLNYSGKAVYGVLAGSEVIDFSNKCTAFDLKDGDVSDLIEYKWPEGSLSENKINKGTWVVTVLSKDKSGNETQLSVTVIAANKLEVTVTFDGKNASIYKIGDHIAPIADPVKKDEVGKYNFIGWYFNERPWDFENDYIVQDMNLVSKFEYEITTYCVSFTVEGLEDSSSFNMYLASGSILDIELFNKNGYTLEAYVNGEKVDSITVNGNMNAKLVYKSTSPIEPEKKGCGGSVVAASSIVSLLSGAAIILLVSSKKKGGKEHE